MRILIAEDEPDIWRPYQIALEARNHKVLVTETGKECLKLYHDELLEKKKASIEMSSPNEGIDVVSSFSLSSPPPPPFDVVVLDYRIPEKNGMEVAKEIIHSSPDQRIIFASAYVKDALEESVRELKRVVELLQKPFEPDVLVETVEDVAIYAELKKLMTKSKYMHESEPTQDQMRDLFEGLRKIQRNRTF